MTKIFIILMSAFFGLFMGANHVVLDKIIIGQAGALEYDLTIFALLFIYILTITYYEYSRSREIRKNSLQRERFEKT